jgi:hypothetical protein
VASPKRVEANRKNASRSTGPKTETGKARVARNAVTHGLTARPEAITDGDGTHAYRESVRAWVGELRPVGVVEMALVERACRGAWRLSRCARLEDAEVARRARSAVDRHDREEAARVDWIGRRLVAKFDHVRFNTPEPVEHGGDPDSLLSELKETARGVAWLLARWTELGRALAEHGYWDGAHRFIAVRLLGLRPEDVLTNSAVGTIYAACHALDPEDAMLWTSCYLTGAIQSVNSEDSARVDALEATVPDPDDASRTLRSLVRRERSRLRTRKAEVLDARSAADHEGAADRALFGEASALLLRYQSASSRDLSRSLADLARMRKEKAREEAESGSDDERPSRRRTGSGRSGTPSPSPGTVPPPRADPPGEDGTLDARDKTTEPVSRDLVRETPVRTSEVKTGGSRTRPQPPIGERPDSEIAPASSIGSFRRNKANDGEARCQRNEVKGPKKCQGPLIGNLGMSDLTVGYLPDAGPSPLRCSSNQAIASVRACSRASL